MAPTVRWMQIQYRVSELHPEAYSVSCSKKNHISGFVFLHDQSISSEERVQSTGYMVPSASPGRYRTTFDIAMKLVSIRCWTCKLPAEVTAKQIERNMETPVVHISTGDPLLTNKVAASRIQKPTVVGTRIAN